MARLFGKPGKIARTAAYIQDCLFFPGKELQILQPARLTQAAHLIVDGGIHVVRIGVVFILVPRGGVVHKGRVALKTRYTFLIEGQIGGRQSFFIRKILFRKRMRVVHGGFLAVGECHEA